MNRPALVSVIVAASMFVLLVPTSPASAVKPAKKQSRVACVALVDVTAPSGTPVPIESYKRQLKTFFDSCVADHALMQVLPLLDAQGAVDAKFPTAVSDRLADETRCRALLIKAQHDNNPSETRQAEDCISTVTNANGAITGFINNLVAANIDQNRTSTEILTPLVDAAGILANSNATKKHLLVLSPGFQTAGATFNFNLNGTISTNTASALVAQAVSRGFVPPLQGVDVHFSGIGTLDRPIDPAYLDGTRAFWSAYLQAAGLPTPSTAMVVIYTAANYRH